MEKKERILRPVGRIHGGTLLPHLKGTAESGNRYNAAA